MRALVLLILLAGCAATKPQYRPCDVWPQTYQAVLELERRGHTYTPIPDLGRWFWVCDRGEQMQDKTEHGNHFCRCQTK